MSEQLVFESFGGNRLVADAFGAPDAPAVIFLPTAGRPRTFWHGSARALADAGRRAICLDLSGQGDGARSLEMLVADLRAVLAALPSRAVVVAAGFGAIVAIAAAGEEGPSLLSGLALVDVNIWFEREELERRRAALGQSTTDLPDGFDAIGDLIAQQHRLEAALPRIAVPVALIRGSLHETITQETMRRLQALTPNAELTEIEGIGQYLAADREDAFNSILLDFLERHVPRQPLTYLGGSEPRVLRDALGCFGTGVTVVTTVDGEGQPVGLTANSFTSVSLDPPLILFSLAKKSANLQTFVDAERFAVNVLHIGQQPVAGRFIQRDGDRFAGVDWCLRDDAGSPILNNSLASFDCRTHAVHDGGDHLIFIGEVRHAWYEPHRDPLLYFRGRYRRLHFA